MLEYVTIGLGVIAGVAATIAWIYHRGVHSGMDTACEKRIKDDIADVKQTIINMEKHGDAVHGKLFDKIDEVRNLIIQHLDK